MGSRASGGRTARRGVRAASRPPLEKIVRRHPAGRIALVVPRPLEPIVRWLVSGRSMGDCGVSIPSSTRRRAAGGRPMASPPAAVTQPGTRRLPAAPSRPEPLVPGDSGAAPAAAPAINSGSRPAASASPHQRPASHPTDSRMERRRPSTATAADVPSHRRLCERAAAADGSDTASRWPRGQAGRARGPVAEVRRLRRHDLPQGGGGAPQRLPAVRLPLVRVGGPADRAAARRRHVRGVGRRPAGRPIRSGSATRSPTPSGSSPSRSARASAMRPSRARA